MLAESGLMVYRIGSMSSEAGSVLHEPQMHMPQTASMLASRSGDGAVGLMRPGPAIPQQQVHRQTIGNALAVAVASDSIAMADYSNNWRRSHEHGLIPNL